MLLENKHAHLWQLQDPPGAFIVTTATPRPRWHPRCDGCILLLRLLLTTWGWPPASRPAVLLLLLLAEPAAPGRGSCWVLPKHGKPLIITVIVLHCCCLFLLLI